MSGDKSQDSEEKTDFQAHLARITGYLRMSPAIYALPSGIVRRRIGS
ncbi:hypothetical protein LP417_20205 [Polaromonas sp. P1-6]|nr:hypothetical protein LP417_20205 [Polaromonas sp. P1-6]